MELEKFVRSLDKLFKLPLAECWDNVGLLIQPSSKLILYNILLTNDLTEPVLHEAIQLKTNLIISYHPPIFKAIKRLSQDSWKERIAVKCLEEKIAVYSPHTALDAVSGGINDWLLSPFEFLKVSPIKMHTSETTSQCTSLFNRECQLYCIKNRKIPLKTDSRLNNEKMTTFSIVTSESIDLPKELGDGLRYVADPVIFLSSEGAGRIAILKEGYTISFLLQEYKKLFNLSSLKLAIGYGKSLESPVSCLAVCAGSGGSLFEEEPMAYLADFLVTGEASHHQQLDAVSRGVTILTVGHSVSERGYLSQRLKPWLLKEVKNLTLEDDQISIHVSEMDSEPGEIL